jgi:hypothetical protein
MEFTRSELRGYDTIELSHSGDELKIDEGHIRVWLTHPENRAYDGDYQIEIKVNGKWSCKSYLNEGIELN